MQFRIFAVGAGGDHDAEEEFNAFLRSHRVVDVRREFTSGPGGPCWCFCVEYLEGPASSGPGSAKTTRRRIDYKEILEPEEFTRYVALREARKRLAEQEAVPVFAICTNDQLAEIARRRPTSVSALAEIDGIGVAKRDKYGEALIATIAPAEDHETSGQSD